MGKVTNIIKEFLKPGSSKRQQNRENRIKAKQKRAKRRGMWQRIWKRGLNEEE